MLAEIKITYSEMNGRKQMITGDGKMMSQAGREKVKDNDLFYLCG